MTLTNHIDNTSRTTTPPSPVPSLNQLHKWATAAGITVLTPQLVQALRWAAEWGWGEGFRQGIVYECEQQQQQPTASPPSPDLFDEATEEEERRGTDCPQNPGNTVNNDLRYFASLNPMANIEVGMTEQTMRQPWKATYRRGRWTAHCPKGLWSVSGPDRSSVEGEALRYWTQYQSDGEYEEEVSE